MDALDLVWDHAPRLHVLDRFRGLHVLGRLGGAHFFRRSFGDVDRAANGERSACRDSGQFRQGHSYRHGCSLSIDGIWPDRPAMAGTASPVHAKNRPIRPIGNAINHDSRASKPFFWLDSAVHARFVPLWNRNAADSEAPLRLSAPHLPVSESNSPLCKPAGGASPRCFQPPSLRQRPRAVRATRPSWIR